MAKKTARKKAAPKKKATGTQVSMFGRTVKKMRKKAVKRTKRGAKADQKRAALPAGKRVSRTGRTYTERRANRAD